MSNRRTEEDGSVRATARRSLGIHLVWWLKKKTRKKRKKAIKEKKSWKKRQRTLLSPLICFSMPKPFQLIWWRRQLNLWIGRNSQIVSPSRGDPSSHALTSIWAKLFLLSSLTFLLSLCVGSYRVFFLSPLFWTNFCLHFDIKSPSSTHIFVTVLCTNSFLCCDDELIFTALLRVCLRSNDCECVCVGRFLNPWNKNLPKQTG